MARGAVPSAAGSAEVQVYERASDQPLRLIPHLTHHHVDGLHLWIGVEDGVLLILDGEQNRFFEELRAAGCVPARLLADGGGSEARWNAIVALVEKCAEAGFLEDIDGYHDVCRTAPERFARLHLTARCQLRCVHCYAASGPEADGSRELTPEHWRRIIDDISEAGGRSVLFTGGEPLIRDDCASLMRHASERGLEVTLFTNGLLVEKRLPAFAGAVSLVQVSLNGPDEASNDPIRGKGTFGRVMRAIELLVAAKVPVRIGMTVMERNWAAIRSGFPAFAERFAHNGVRFHLGHGVCRYGRGESLDDRLDLDEVRPIIEQFLEAANGPPGRRITRKTTNCGYCEQLVIAPDGGVYPCHLLHGVLGHIDDRPVRDWHRVLRETEERHLVHTISGCAECDLRNLCGGTCRVINEQTTGSKWITTCTSQQRAARYHNLVSLFHKSTQKGGEDIGRENETSRQDGTRR